MTDTERSAGGEASRVRPTRRPARRAAAPVAALAALFAGLGALAVAPATRAAPVPWPLTVAEPSGHRDLAAEHAALPPQPPSAFAPRVPLSHAGSSAPRVAREVIGYLPYWEHTASAPYTPARWDLLTVLAWFGVEMSATGVITTWRGWGGEHIDALVADAHAHGVKVVLTVTNFTNAEIATLVNSATHRATAIANILDAIAMHGVDGVNIDFEFVPLSGRAGFVTFMTELKQAVAAVAPNGHAGHVTLAGPAVDWSGAYDYRALLENTDGVMVMAYGYHWSGSDPGPTSPLYGGSPWPTRAIDWTVDDYLAFGGEENRHKVVIGLPWYGRSWPVPDTDVPTTASGSGSAIFFRVAEAEVDGYGRLWNEHTRSTYYHKTTSGQLRQVWYDDHRAFDEKVAYIEARDLGGLGIWALGYEGSYPDLWDAIDAHLVPDEPEPGPEPGPEPAVEAAIAEPVADVSEPAVDAVSDDATEVAEGSGGGEPGPFGVSVGRPLRDVHARTLTDPGGCGLGGPAPGVPLALAAGLLLLLAVRRRRAKNG